MSNSFYCCTLHWTVMMIWTRKKEWTNIFYIYSKITENTFDTQSSTSILDKRFRVHFNSLFYSIFHCSEHMHRLCHNIALYYNLNLYVYTNKILNNFSNLIFYNWKSTITISEFLAKFVFIWILSHVLSIFHTHTHSLWPSNKIA